MKFAMVALIALSPVGCWALVEQLVRTDEDFNKLFKDWDDDMKKLLEEDQHIVADNRRPSRPDLPAVDDLSALQIGQAVRQTARQAASRYGQQAATPPTLSGVPASGAYATQQPGGGAQLAAPAALQASAGVDQELARTHQLASLLAQDASMLAGELGKLQGVLHTRGIKEHSALYRTGYKEVTPGDAPDFHISVAPREGGTLVRDPDLAVDDATPPVMRPMKADKPGQTSRGVLDLSSVKGLQTTPTGGEGANATGSVEKDTNPEAWFQKRTFKSSFFTLNHKLSDFSTCLFWSGASVLMFILVGVCCVRPLLRRRQEARNERLI